MAWNLEYIEDLQIVELTISGHVTGDELIEAAAARIAMGRDKQADRYIINARQIDAPKSATPAVFNIPNRLYAEENLPRKSQIAVVAPESKESAWVTNFYEDICVNRGWRVRTFSAREQAIVWLQGSEN